MGNAVKAPQIINNRYQVVEHIGEGSLGVVYRVYDKLRDDYVALKIIHQKYRHSDLTEQSSQFLTLANEFRILAGLRHPHIISVLDYGFDDDQFPFFTMSLIENAHKITAEHESTHINKLRILTELLTALSFLHHHGIIHRDLKPENVLINKDGQVKVLDFGLALLWKYSDEPNSVSGTLQYMAPEVLMGAPVSVVSDLYSVGIIAYELFTGRYPFDVTDVNRLIQDIVQRIPDLSGFSDELSLFLGRLVAKDPNDRYTDTESAINALHTLTHYESPDKKIIFSETVLQSTKFVGRSAEVRYIDTLLKATKSSKGQLLLVEGESGVGKTRLLNEIRIRALIDNIVVMRDNTPQDSNLPYGLWHDILRWLAILTPLTPLEASVIKMIVPDIGRFVPFAVIDAPELSIQSTQERITQIITGLVKRQSKPILMLLEDLQWADEQSLDLLHTLSLVISDLPILILVSCRDSKADSMTARFTEAHKISLQRFDNNQIVELSESILGKSTHDSKLIDYLMQATQGNALFIIEVFRNLSSLAGGLRNIIDFSIPLHTTGNSLMSTLQQRLENIPPESRRLLEYAAIIGSKVDPKLMQQLFPAENIDQWLLICFEFSVIEANENQWFFSHSNTRNYLLSGLDNQSQQWRDMHRDIAHAIEAVYPDDESYHIALANHWTQAQDSQKALPYLEKSAFQVAKSSPNLAIQFMQTANQLNAQKAHSDHKQLALHYSILGNAYYSMGDNENATSHFARAIHYMGYRPAPQSNWKAGLGLLQQLLIQTTHRIFPNWFINKQDSEHFRSLMYYALLNAQVVHLYRGEDVQALYTVLLTLNTVESLKPSSEFSSTLIYAAMTLFTGLAGLHRVAGYYRNLTENSLDEGSHVHRVQALALLGVYAFQQAQWEKAIRLCSDVLDQFKDMGDMHDYDEGRNVLARVYHQSGDIPQALELLKSAYLTTRERSDRVVQFAVYSAMVYIQIQLDEPLDKVEDIDLLTDHEQANQYFDEAFTNNQSNKALFTVLQSAYQLKQGNHEEAYTALVAGHTLVKPSVERNWNYYELYALIPELSYRLTMQSNTSLSADQRTTLLSIMQVSTRFLKKYAKIFVYARPLQAIADGWLAEMSGDTATAITCYQQAIAQADEIGTPHHKTLASDMLSRVST